MTLITLIKSPCIDVKILTDFFKCQCPFWAFEIKLKFHKFSEEKNAKFRRSVERIHDCIHALHELISM